MSSSNAGAPDSPEFSSDHTRMENSAAGALLALSHGRSLNQVPDEYKYPATDSPLNPDVQEAIDHIIDERRSANRLSPGSQAGPSRSSGATTPNIVAGPSRFPYNAPNSGPLPWIAPATSSQNLPHLPAPTYHNANLAKSIAPLPRMRTRPPAGAAGPSNVNKPLPSLPSAPGQPSPFDPVALTPHSHRPASLPFTATEADIRRVAELYRVYNKKKMTEKEIREMRIRNWKAGRIYSMNPLNPRYNAVPAHMRMDPEFHPHVKLGGKNEAEMAELLKWFTPEERKFVADQTDRDRAKAIHATWLAMYCDGFTFVGVENACRRCLQGGWVCFFAHSMYDKGSIVLSQRKSKRRAIAACVPCHVSKASCSHPKDGSILEHKLMEADLQRYWDGHIKLGELFNRQMYPFGSVGPYTAEEAGKAAVDAILKRLKEEESNPRSRNDTPTDSYSANFDDDEFDELDDDDNDSVMAGPSRGGPSRVKAAVAAAKKTIKKVASKKSLKAPAKPAAPIRVPRAPRVSRGKRARSPVSDSDEPPTATVSDYNSPEPEEGMSRYTSPAPDYLAPPSNMRGEPAEDGPPLSPEMCAHEREGTSPAVGTPVEDETPVLPSPRRKRTAAEMQANDGISAAVSAMQIRQMQDRDTANEPSPAEMKESALRRGFKMIGDKFNLLKRAQSAEPSDAEGDLAEASERPAKRFRALSDNVGGDAVRPSLMGAFQNIAESEEETESQAPHNQVATGHDPRYLSAEPPSWTGRM